MTKNLFRIPENKLRLITGDMGGSFGMKAAAYPEYIACLHAARERASVLGLDDERVSELKQQGAFGAVEA